MRQSRSCTKVPSFPGKTERDIFKNYYKERRGIIQDFFTNTELISKDDEKSTLLASGSDKDFQEKNYFTCLVNYTESLRHANYNSKAYAAALQKRSAVYFILESFENCAIDLKLCLEADYPTTEKPELYIKMVDCYSKIGNWKKMFEAIDDFYNFMKNCVEISEDLRNDYLKEIEDIRKLNDFSLKETKLVNPPLEADAEMKEPHPLNSSVSSSIKFQFNNTSETDYIAARDIPYGEVLFIENAYTIGIANKEGKEFGVFFCDYCLAEARNCIPCRTCVKLLYCSENCRIKAWNDYHQWECIIIRAHYLPNAMFLSLRTVIKAACSGVIKEILSKKPIKSGKNTDPYLNLYSIFADLVSLRAKRIKKFYLMCQHSVFMVEYLKKTNFFSHLMSTTLRNIPFDELVDLIGGLLLKHNIHASQRTISVNLPSPVIEILEESKQNLKLSCMRIRKFNAFCPMISGVPYSCIYNTNINFHGYTAVVKASRNIKVGERIYRSTFNLCPNTSLKERTNLLTCLLITCKCESCLDIKKSCDIYDTFICPACGGYALLEDSDRPSMSCLYCNINSTASEISKQLGSYNLASESEDLETKINFLENLKAIANPHHKYIHEMYQGILQLRSKEEDTNEFIKALEDFKNCSKTRYQFGDPYDYLQDIITICESFFQFLYNNKVNIKDKGGLDFLNIFSELIEEAKKIAVDTFPPILQLLMDLEVYLLRYRIVHIDLKV